MCSFPYGRQVLFHISFSLCASAFLGYAVLHCNFVEITSAWGGINGASIGFWKVQDEINGNLDSNGRFSCVAYTPSQKESFDALWNYGRYGGPLIFSLSCLVTLGLLLTMFMELHPKTEKRLAILQFILAAMSALLLLALESKICHEFRCWLDIGGVLCIAASLIYVVGGWITLSLRYAPQERRKKGEGGPDFAESDAVVAAS